MTHQPPKQGEPGFSRDEDLEPTRPKDRPAEADLDASREKAAREPTLFAPDDEDDPEKS